MNENLQPCPFCGATHGLYVLDEDSTVDYPHIFCDNCKSIFANEHAETLEQASEMFNNRAPVATDKFFILPKPDKKLGTVVKDFDAFASDFVSVHVGVAPYMDGIIDYINKLADYDCSKEVVKALAVAYGIIDSAKSDSKPLIHCKDCKHYRGIREGYLKFCTKHGHMAELDDFCSWGEEKDEHEVQS